MKESTPTAQDPAAEASGLDVFEPDATDVGWAVADPAGSAVELAGPGLTESMTFTGDPAASVWESAADPLHVEPMTDDGPSADAGTEPHGAAGAAFARPGVG